MNSHKSFLLAGCAVLAATAGATNASAAPPKLSQIQATIALAGPTATTCYSTFYINPQPTATVTETVLSASTGAGPCGAASQGFVGKVNFGKSSKGIYPAEGIIAAAGFSAVTYITMTSYPFPVDSTSNNATTCGAYPSTFSACTGLVSVWAATGDGHTLTNLVQAESSGFALSEPYTRVDSCQLTAPFTGCNPQT